jgi:hypothetical protein
MHFRVVRGFHHPAACARPAARADATRDGWLPGRQATAYDKLPLAIDADADAWLAALAARSRVAMGDPATSAWDHYLLRYRVGASVPRHVDPSLAAGLRHLRLNAVVRACDAGGVLSLDGAEVALAAGDAVVFRPDRVVHAVTSVGAGERLVWSVGCNH